MNPTKTLTADELNKIAQSSGYKGGSFSNVGLAIPVDKLNTPVPVPPKITPPVDTNNYSAMFKSGEAVIGSNTGALGETTPTTTAEKAPSWYEKLLSQIKPTTGSSAYTGLETTAGITEKEADLLAKQQIQKTAQGKLSSLEAKLAGINAEAEASALRSEGRLAPMGAIRGEQAQIERQRAIRALPIQTEVLVAQAEIANAKGDVELASGILQQAKDRVGRIFQIERSDAQNEYNFKKDLIDKFYQFATDEQKAKLDEKKTKDTQDFQLLRDAINNKDSLAKTALENGQATLASQITQLDAKSPTFANDLARLQSQIIKKTEGGNGVYTPKQLSAITKINQDVSKNATYTKTTSMRNYGDNVLASLSLATGVGDISAINQFQKVIDEGAVTRDQDVKLIQSSQSLLNTLKTKLKKLEKGEQLSPELRTEMRQAVEKMYEKQVEALQKDPYISAKTKEAELYGLTPEDTILGELTSFTRKQETHITGGEGVTSSGVKYTVIGGETTKTQTNPVTPLTTPTTVKSMLPDMSGYSRFSLNSFFK